MKTYKYTLPVKYDAINRRAYERWGRKNAKRVRRNIILMAIAHTIIIGFILNNIMIAVNRYITDANGIMEVLKIHLVIYIVFCVISKIFIIIDDTDFKLMNGIPREPSVMNIEISGEHVRIYTTRDGLVTHSMCTDIINVDKELDIEGNCIEINRLKYKIGENNRETIYLDGSVKPYFKQPVQRKDDITSVKEMKDILDEYRNNLQKKSIQNEEFSTS